MLAEGRSPPVLEARHLAVRPGSDMISPTRYFKLKTSRGVPTVAWLNRHTVYEGRLISMTARTVRLFSPNSGDRRPYVDLSYDWVTPLR